MRASEEKAIRDHVLASLDDETKRLIRLANYDLYCGPVTEPDDGEPWPGFIGACRAIRDAIEVRTLYLDTQSGEITDIAPETCTGCDDPDCTASDPADWYELERHDVLRIALGRELAPYVVGEARWR